MKYQHQNPLVATLLILSLLFSFVANAASPMAGTLIKNQASATYKDASGVEHFATSNLVETLIQHVAAMDLVQDQTRPGALDNTVYFPHVLTNNGNDIDSFALTATNNTGDQYDFTVVKVYADANQDGLPDSTTEIATTGNLSAQEEFYFVVATTLPAAGPAVDDQAQITVTGESDFENTVSQSNVDTVTVSDKAIIDVTKSMSASTGYSPSAIFTVTLSYANNSAEAATDVTLMDALPAGMTYVAGSAKWSETGTTVLTDNDKNDNQSGITYCAYHTDCISLPSNGDSTQQVTAILTTVAAGESGILTFNAQIASGVAAATLHNAADYEYDNGTGVVPRLPSNKVPYEVLAQPVVVANGSDDDSDPDNADNVGGTTDAFVVASANQGETVVFDNIIRNKGNSTDTFDISIDASIANPFPVNTVFQLYQEDGFTPLLDTNNNGTVDTGPVAADGKYTVVLKAVLPVNATAGNNGGAGFNVTKTATSSIDTSVSDSVTDRLQSIVGSSVDLTNNAAIGGAGVAGVGAGPETNPVTTVTAAPGNNAIFNLYVNNTSAVSSSYQLEYSMEAPFDPGKIVANVKINFYNDGGNNDCSTQGTILTATGVIPALGSKQVCAVVSIPADAVANKDVNGLPIAYPVYFRAISALNNSVSDIKHDAVIIGDTPALSIAPDQQGQVQPGNTITYSHRITNNGNTPLECINVSSVDTQTDWSSVVYHDVNEDGQLDSGDIQLTDQVLNTAESFTILIKIFAPATVPMGTKNTSTLTVSGHQDDGDGNPTICNGAVLSDTAIDLTTVNNSEVSIRKEQSADNNCDGVSDSGVFTTTTFQVDPQACVIYKLTAINAGATPVNNVRIDDASPTFTVFHNAGGLPTVTQGNIEGGAAGNEGSITGGSVGGTAITLSPGQSMVLTFGVKLD